MKLEICVETFASAQAARDGGADRIEVCGALGIGGITPSAGLVDACLALSGLDVMQMIRPHGGNFCYDEHDADVMLRDIRRAKKAGVYGVVFGALRADHRIDASLCQRLIDAARPMSVTFHRAFDLTPDPLEALDALLDLHVDRLLTSGQAASALAGADVIQQLVARAGDSLVVMAGAGVRANNVAELVRRTGVREVHASASENVRRGDDSLELVHPTRITRATEVRAIRDALRAFD